MTDTNSLDHIIYDEFRKVERAIRQLTKPPEKKKIKSNDDVDPTEICDFDWSTVLDIQQDHSFFHSLNVENRSTNSNCSDIYTNVNPNAKVYQIDDTPSGFYFVSQALSVESQIYWVNQALQVYSKAEHNNISNLHKQSQFEKNVDGNVKANGQQPALESEGISNSYREENELWEKFRVNENGMQNFFKLRWSCLGYHYDWTARMYQRDLKSGFPQDLRCLHQSIASLINMSYEPEAGIVNYYPLNTVMGGHLDDAEHAMDKPIISISLGCSCIFLIGGRNKSVPPKSIILRSGDALIMSGESRYCYHGVPFIIPPDYVLPTFDALKKRFVDNYYGKNKKKIKELKEYILKTLRPTVMNRVEEKSLNDNGSQSTDSEPKSIFNLHNRNGNYAYYPEVLNYYDKVDNETKAVLDYIKIGRININSRQVRNDDEGEKWIVKSGTGGALSKA